MKITVWLAALAALVGGGAIVQEKQDSAAASRPAAQPGDVASVDAVVAAVYDVISGPAGKARDWDRMRSLFATHARLIAARSGPDGKIRLRDMSVDDYIQGAGPYLEKDGFFEREAARKLESFGHIAHVFSTYESRHTAGDDKPFQRGINSIQLMNDGTRWWITSLVWDSESEKQPIPADYLPKGGAAK